MQRGLSCNKHQVCYNKWVCDEPKQVCEKYCPKCPSAYAYTKAQAETSGSGYAEASGDAKAGTDAYGSKAEASATAAAVSYGGGAAKAAAKAFAGTSGRRMLCYEGDCGHCNCPLKEKCYWTKKHCYDKQVCYWTC